MVQTVQSVPVVASLGGRQGSIVLHPHIQHVCRVAGDAAQDAGGGGEKDESRERRGMARVVGGEARLEFRIDAKAGR